MKTKTNKKGNINELAWLENAMQGLVHWMSYKKIFFNKYMFSEGALAAELWGLINSQLASDNIFLIPEVSYKEVKINSQERTDIVIKEFINNKPEIKYWIELKRYQNIKKVKIDKKGNEANKKTEKLTNVSNIGKIIMDFKKISKAVKKNSSQERKIKYYSLIVSENTIPEEFVNKDRGNKYPEFNCESLDLKKSELNNCDLKIIFAKKSLSSKRKEYNRGNWAILIEIF